MESKDASRSYSTSSREIGPLLARLVKNSQVQLPSQFLSVSSIRSTKLAGWAKEAATFQLNVSNDVSRSHNSWAIEAVLEYRIASSEGIYCLEQTLPLRRKLQ